MSTPTEPTPPPYYQPDPSLPPVYVPPPSGGGAQPSGTPGGKKVRGPLGAILTFLAAGAKWIIPALKGGKFLLTGASMFVTMWFYSLQYGWPFAALFVVGIFIHEIGHVLVASALGVP